MKEISDSESKNSSAKNSLPQVDLAQLFSQNKKFVKTIKNKANLQTIVGNLVVKQNIDGDCIHQQEQPLLATTSFYVNLENIVIQEGAEKKTLVTMVNHVCDTLNLGRATQAEFTAVSTLLAGNAISEEGLTSAEFVPLFYNPTNENTNVFVLVYSIDGGISVRQDHLLVRSQENMACLNRNGDKTKNSTIKAIGVPNEIAEELQQRQSELFSQLQKSSSLVIFIEYDVLEHHIVKLESEAGAAISTYSRIGQGSTISDHSQKVAVSGKKMLKKISIYSLSPLVVNHDLTQCTDSYVEHVTQLLEQRAQTIALLFKPYKEEHALFYFEFKYTINKFLITRFGVSTQNTDIFENTLLRLGKNKKSPAFCKFDPINNNTAIAIQLDLEHQSKVKLVANLNELFDLNFCTLTQEEASR